MDSAGRHRAVQLHADLERLLRNKTSVLRGMTLTVFHQLVAEARDQHQSDPVVSEAALRATEAVEADPSDPMAPAIQVQEALVVVGQLMALPLVG